MLENRDKEKCIEFIIGQIDSKSLKIHELYNDILAAALNSICNEDLPQRIGIWEEHYRSSIIRTIIECCYPYVIKERDSLGVAKNGYTVIVTCSEGEYHEMGARMAADFFTMVGYNSVFIGSNTPQNELIDAINTMKPRYIAFSVIGYYNLVAAKRSIQNIRQNFGNTIKILAGGHALSRNPAVFKEIGADVLLNTYEEILRLKEDQ